MKIKQLKKLINYLPDNMEVILSKDEEGNGFHKLAGSGISPCLIDKNFVEVHNEEDEDIPDLAEDCLVLWPARPDRGYDRIGRRTTMLKPGSPGGA